MVLQLTHHIDAASPDGRACGVSEGSGGRRSRLGAVGPKAMVALAALLLVLWPAIAAAGGRQGTVLRAYYSVHVPAGGHVRRPTRIVFGADGRTYLDGMQWRRWGGRFAVARGTYDYDGGPAGEPMITTEPALIVASDPARCDGWRTYLRLKARIEGDDGTVSTWHALSLATSWHHCQPIR